MKKPHHPAIRELLRQHPDGLTVAQIMASLPQISQVTVATKCLVAMPDAYVDRWADPVRGQWQAVWCVVVPPADCPHPDSTEMRARTRWVGVKQGVYLC